MYNIGDKVMVKNRTYAPCLYLLNLYSGKEVTVIRRRTDNGKNYYVIKELGDTFWNETFFEPIENELSKFTLEREGKNMDRIIVKFKPEFSPKDIKTGMFGVTSDGMRFVVANDLIVYETGTYDRISSLSDDLEFPVTGRKIASLYTDCTCFNEVGNCYCERVYPEPALPKFTLERLRERIGFDFEIIM